jgi:hypothetical protein
MRCLACSLCLAAAWSLCLSAAWADERTDLRLDSAAVRQQAYLRLLSAGAPGRRRLADLLGTVRVEVCLRTARGLLAARAAGGRFASAHEQWQNACQNARRLTAQSISDKQKTKLVALAVDRATSLYVKVEAAAPGLKAALTRLDAMIVHLQEIDRVAPQCGLQFGERDLSAPALDAILGGKSRLGAAVGRMNRWVLLSEIAARCARHNRPITGRKGEGVGELLAATNRYRVRLGLVPLAWHAALARAAAGHSAEMYRLRKVSHQSPTPGRKDPEDRIRAAGYRKYLSVGENVAGGFFRPEAVLAAFRESPAHHRNLVDGAYREVGIARTADKWAMNFGAPVRSPWASVRPVVLSWPATQPVADNQNRPNDRGASE